MPHYLVAKTPPLKTPYTRYHVLNPHQDFEVTTKDGNKRCTSAETNSYCIQATGIERGSKLIGIYVAFRSPIIRLISVDGRVSKRTTPKVK